MSDVTGQQGVSTGRYPTWVRAEGQRYREDIDVLIRATLVDLLTEDAESHLGPLTARHVTASGVLGAELALDGRHGLPLRVRGAGGVVHTLHTRADRRRWGDRWAAHVARLHDRAVMYSAALHRQFDAVDYTVPVHDPEGRVLTGREELHERVRLWGEFINHWHVRDRDGRNEARRRTALLGTAYDLTPHAVSADLETARGQYLDRLDDAAAEVRAWLLDDPDGLGAGPATAAQRAELERLEERRQAGRRNVRAATLRRALDTAFTAAAGLIRGAGLEAGPVWRTAAGAAISGTAAFTGGRLSVTAPAPGVARWSYAVRVGNPSPTVSGRPALGLGHVVLDPADAPAGWTVSSTRRAPPNTHERNVTIAQTATPEAGTYEFPITARNGGGPSKLVVAVTVPAATGESA